MLIDVGGGTGELLTAILRSYPNLRGAVFDLARCADAARRRVQDANLADRAQFIAGDFFHSVPDGADIMTLKSVIHDWDDARAAQILRNCRRSLSDHGKIILVERVMPEMPAERRLDRASALSDLNMLRGPGGRERTETEYRQLLTTAGFRPLRVIPAERYCLIEGMAV
jgi:ubiquinone/menaquinone biosynthesis C-methylase UbiE